MQRLMHHFKSTLTLAILITTMSTQGMELQIQEKATEKGVRDLVTSQKVELESKSGKRISELPQNVYDEIIGTTFKLEEAINAAKALQKVRHNNLNDFTKLVHVLANKFDELPVTVAEKFNTSIAKTYIELHDTLGRAIVNSDIGYTKQLILEGADLTGHVLTLMFAWTTILKEKQFASLKKELLKIGTDPQFLTEPDYEAVKSVLEDETIKSSLEYETTKSLIRYEMLKSIPDVERAIKTLDKKIAKRECCWNYYKYALVLCSAVQLGFYLASFTDYYSDNLYLVSFIPFFISAMWNFIQTIKLDTCIGEECIELEKAIQLGQSLFDQEDLIKLHKEDMFFKKMDLSECSNMATDFQVYQLLSSIEDSSSFYLSHELVQKIVTTAHITRLREIDCTVCWDTKDISDCHVILGCNHVFCKECLAEGINACLTETNSTKQLKCPYNGCVQKIDVSDVHAIVIDGKNSDDSTNQRSLYEKFIEIRAYEIINNSKSAMKPCPIRGCNCIHIVATDQIPKCTECSICHHFCCTCGYADHPGITCQADAEIDRDCVDCGIRHARVMTCEAAEKDKKDDAANEKIARRCPVCHKPAVKNGGCNHMTCGCGYQFCWTCGGAYGNGGCSSSKCATRNIYTGYNF